MKKLLHYLALGVMLAAFPACEMRFELDKISDSKMYVQYVPSPETSRILIGYAEPAFGKTSDKPYVFEDSDLTVTVNGSPAQIVYLTKEETDELQLYNPEGNTRFASAGTPSPLKPGDKIDLSLKGRNTKTAHASTVIPPMPEIADVVIKREQNIDSTEFLSVKLKLKKAVSENDYYGLKVVVRTTYVSAHTPFEYYDDDEPGIVPWFEMPPGIILDTTEVISAAFPGHLASTADLNSLDLDAFAHVPYWNGMLGRNTFSDEPMMLLGSKMFDGDTYSFYLNSMDSSAFGPSIGLDFSADPDFLSNYDPEQPFYQVIGGKSELMLEVYALSEELFNYCKAMYLESYNMLSNFGLSPPNFTYTNVHDGLGVVGGLSRCVTSWYTVSNSLESSAGAAAVSAANPILR